MEEEEKMEFVAKWIAPLVGLLAIGLLTCHIFFDTVDQAAVAAIEKYEGEK